MRVVVVALVVAAVVPARADCPDHAANCVLHEEGVALLVAGKYGEAVGKFKASIAAGPTARAYLGYAQALEGDGKVALAYEAMVVAQQMSGEELAKNPNDVDIRARGERIKYKQAELATKVGFAWLRLPDGVAPQRLVAVRRKDESDIPSPLTHLIAVAPHQELSANLTDGTKLDFTADIAPGTTAAVVIPVGGSRVATGGMQPGLGGATPPVGGIYQPLPPPPEPPLTETSLGLDGGFMLPNFADVSEGYGIFGYYERRVSSGLMLAIHSGYIHHPSRLDANSGNEITGGEIFTMAGLRTATRSKLYGLAGAGFTVLAVRDSSGMADSTFGYPVLEAGAGLRFGSFRLQTTFDYAINVAGGDDIGMRFLMTVGFDLYRR